MAKPKLYLDSKPNTNKQYPILLLYSFNGKRLKYYTGVSVEEKFFQSKCNTGNAKPLKSIAPYSEQLNNRLLDMITSAISIVSEAKGEELTIQHVRSELDRIYKYKDEPISEQTEKSTSFIKLFEITIQNSESGKRLIKSGANKGNRFKHNAIKNYKVTLSAVKRYMKYNNIKDLDLADIDQNFYEEFRTFCFDVEEKEISTFSGYIKDIKTIMIESEYPGFKKENFYMPNYESDTLALTLEQVDMIHNLDLSDREKFIEADFGTVKKKIFYPALDNIRDLFLIGCYSAMRFQNYNDLSIEAIENGFIRIKQKKTGKRTTIPVMKRLQMILDKNQGRLPESVSNQHFNRVIKYIVKLAGLDHTITVKQSKGNKESFVEVPFYEQVSSHTARRTYATVMFKAGVPPLLIMSATGHTTEKSFLKYIRATNEDKAKLLAETIKKLGL